VFVWVTEENYRALRQVVLSLGTELNPVLQSRIVVVLVSLQTEPRGPVCTVVIHTCSLLVGVR